MSQGYQIGDDDTVQKDNSTTTHTLDCAAYKQNNKIICNACDYDPNKKEYDANREYKPTAKDVG